MAEDWQRLGQGDYSLFMMCMSILTGTISEDPETLGYEVIVNFPQELFESLAVTQTNIETRMSMEGGRVTVKSRAKDSRNAERVRSAMQKYAMSGVDAGVPLAPEKKHLWVRIVETIADLGYDMNRGDEDPDCELDLGDLKMVREMFRLSDDELTQKIVDMSPAKSGRGKVTMKVTTSHDDSQRADERDQQGAR